MSNNAVIRSETVQAVYRPLSVKTIVGSFEIACSPTNAGDVYFLGDTGTDVPWEPGEYHTFRGIDLARMKIKGTPGDIVKITGGVW